MKRRAPRLVASIPVSVGVKAVFVISEHLDSPCVIRAVSRSSLTVVVVSIRIKTAAVVRVAALGVCGCFGGGGFGGGCFGCGCFGCGCFGCGCFAPSRSGSARLSPCLFDLGCANLCPSGGARLSAASRKLGRARMLSRRSRLLLGGRRAGLPVPAVIARRGGTRTYDQNGEEHKRRHQADPRLEGVVSPPTCDGAPRSPRPFRVSVHVPPCLLPRSTFLRPGRVPFLSPVEGTTRRGGYESDDGSAGRAASAGMWLAPSRMPRLWAH